MSRPQSSEGPAATGGRSLARALAVATFLSGAAALAYQVLWTRELGLVLGHGVAAVSTVLAIFMAGLGLGSAFAARRADSLPPARRAQAFAILELGIAACGLAFPLLRGAAEPLASLVQRSADAPALLAATRAVVAAAVLLVPTALMGATLPVLAARLAPAAHRTGAAAGFLYAANAAGAVAGSLATPLVLLPGLGVYGATIAAAALNVAAAGLAWATREKEAPADAPAPARRSKKRAGPPVDAPGLPPAVVLAVVTLSGLGALADEVAWTRVLVLLIGPTAYAFAFILAAVIAGIALGSAAASAWLRRGRAAASALAAVQILAALASLVVVHAVATLPLRVGEIVRANADRMDRLLGLQLAGVAALLLPACLCFGAAFPLAVAALAGAGSRPGRAVGHAYAWNTAGAIAGALLAGFVALPRWGSRTTLVAAAAAHALAGLLALTPWRGGPRPRTLAAVAAGLFALAAWRAAPWDRELLAGGVYKYGAYRTALPLEDELRAGELAYYREGSLATVSVKRLGSKLSLAVDGKIDATSAGDMLTQRLLAHVPLLLHPRPRRVCVVGLGSGVTAGSVLAHPVDALDAVEISPEVVEAAALFARENRGVLSDPRLRLRVADARNHLLVTLERYDVVISEPSNPWMAGVSSLFTRDFFRLARERLAPNGLFCQWTHIYNMRGEELRTIVGGFVDVFPESALFLVNEGDLLLVGGNGLRPSLDPAALSERMGREPVRGDLQAVGVRSPSGFARLFTLETPALAAWAGEAPRHTDDRPRLELQAARSLHADTARANRLALTQAARASSPPSWVAALRANPRGVDAVERARMLEQAGSFEWGLETFREALALDPASREASEGLVRCALAAGQGAAAERDLLGAAAGSDTVAIRIGLALLYHNAGRAPEALAQLENAARLDPRERRILLLGAEVQAATGNVEAMEGLARAALELAPDDPDVQALAAEVNLRAGRLEAASGVAEQILRREPGHARAREVAAIAAAGRKERAAARAHFDALVASAPDGWSYFDNFGTFELQEGNVVRAARLFEQSLELNPSGVAAHRGLREAARALGDAPMLARAERGLARLAAP